MTMPRASSKRSSQRTRERPLATALGPSGLRPGQSRSILSPMGEARMRSCSDSIAQLAAALAKAQIELVNPVKTLTGVIDRWGTGNEGQSYRYAPLSAGLDIVRQTLCKHELAVIQTTEVDRESGIDARAWVGRMGRRVLAGLPDRRPHSGSAWPPGRRRGGGSQAGRPVLAPSHEGNGLSLGATRAGGHQEAEHGAPGRSAGQEGESTRSGLCLQRQGTQESGDARRDPGRAGLRALRRPMAAARTRQGSARAPQSGQARMIRRPDEASSRRPALRHEVARADEK